MLQRPVTEAARLGYILGMGKIVMYLVEQTLCIVEAIGALQVCVNRRMIVDIFTVIDRCLLDFTDGAVDFIDSVLLMAVHAAIGPEMIEEAAGMAQVGKGMQVCGMRSGDLLGMSAADAKNASEDNEKCNCERFD